MALPEALHCSASSRDCLTLGNCDKSTQETKQKKHRPNTAEQNPPLPSLSWPLPHVSLPSFPSPSPCPSPSLFFLLVLSPLLLHPPLPLAAAAVAVLSVSGAAPLSVPWYFFPPASPAVPPPWPSPWLLSVPFVLPLCQFPEWAAEGRDSTVSNNYHCFMLSARKGEGRVEKGTLQREKESCYNR